MPWSRAVFDAAIEDIKGLASVGVMAWVAASANQTAARVSREVFEVRNEQRSRKMF